MAVACPWRSSMNSRRSLRSVSDKGEINRPSRISSWTLASRLRVFNCVPLPLAEVGSQRVLELEGKARCNLGGRRSCPWRRRCNFYHAGWPGQEHASVVEDLLVRTEFQDMLTVRNGFLRCLTRISHGPALGRVTVFDLPFSSKPTYPKFERMSIPDLSFFQVDTAGNCRIALLKATIQVG